MQYLIFAAASANLLALMLEFTRHKKAKRIALFAATVLMITLVYWAQPHRIVIQ